MRALSGCLDAGWSAGSTPDSMATSIACGEVMKLMYAAATSAFFDFDVIAHGRLSPPIVADEPPAITGGGSMKPTFPVIFASRSAANQVPPMRNTPWPLAKLIGESSYLTLLASLVR